MKTVFAASITAVAAINAQARSNILRTAQGTHLIAGNEALKYIADQIPEQVETTPEMKVMLLEQNPFFSSTPPPADGAATNTEKAPQPTSDYNSTRNCIRRVMELQRDRADQEQDLRAFMKSVGCDPGLVAAINHDAVESDSSYDNWHQSCIKRLTDSDPESLSRSTNSCNAVTYSIMQSLRSLEGGDQRGMNLEGLVNYIRISFIITLFLFKRRF